ncbi:MAG: pyrimidine dimer DNA glycosylase/endonuclease V, partial [Candidatus Omnitrophota bacterium]
MQTFLPYPDYKKCAQVLDRQRLSKQRVECKQILLANTGQSKGWTHHPVTLMWRGFESDLCKYA